MDMHVTETIDNDEWAEVFDGLVQYNLTRIEDKEPRSMGLYLEDEKGRKIVGLIGETHGKWLTVQALWVDEEYRGKRLGSQVLERAETVARERGCSYVFLDTFGFQAPLFYAKHGYKEVFTLEEYPLTGKRIYFEKTL